MKSAVIWMLRHLIIPVGLIWATGTFGTYYRCVNESKTLTPLYHSFNDTDYQSLELTPISIKKYGDSLYEVRLSQVKNKGTYLPYDYFHDLKQFNMFESKYRDSLDVYPAGRCMLMYNFGLINKFVYLRDDNWHSKDLTKDVLEARKKWFPKEVIYEEEQDKEMQNFSFVHDICQSFVNWLVMFYMRGLPFAFLMLLIWRIQLKNDYESHYWIAGDNKKILWSRFTPLSFLLSLLLWPIILVLDIRNRKNQMLKRIDVLSRREYLISLFSEKEQRLIDVGKRFILSIRELPFKLLGVVSCQPIIQITHYLILEMGKTHSGFVQEIFCVPRLKFIFLN